MAKKSVPKCIECEYHRREKDLILLVVCVILGIIFGKGITLYLQSHNIGLVEIVEGLFGTITYIEMNKATVAYYLLPFALFGLIYTLYVRRYREK